MVSTACVATLAAVMVAPPCGAVADVGASGGPSLRAVPYAPPVDGVVVDPFRPPAGPYAPGNRGLEYSTSPGAPVRAIGNGRVAFAGQVAGRLVVSIDHPDGLRSSVLGVVAIVVRVGDRVIGGQRIGLAGRLLHLGVRRAGTYIDPASLFARRGPAHLVPLDRVPPLRAGFGRIAERR